MLSLAKAWRTGPSGTIELWTKYFRKKPRWGDGLATGEAARPRSGPTRNPWKADVLYPIFFSCFRPGGAKEIPKPTQGKRFLRP
jgi:hypothetical protein